MNNKGAKQPRRGSGPQPQKTLVYKNGLSPLGLLRSALDYARGPATRQAATASAKSAEKPRASSPA
jgi:hypothetical protein